MHRWMNPLYLNWLLKQVSPFKRTGSLNNVHEHGFMHIECFSGLCPLKILTKIIKNPFGFIKLEQYLFLNIRGDTLYAFIW